MNSIGSRKSPSMRRSALVYVRVSSQRQVENFSLGVQEQACRAYCRTQGWQVARVFREEGESAKSADRTQLSALLDYCREHKTTIAAVVVHSLSRWSRDTRDHFALTGLLLKWGMTLRSATEPISDEPEGELMEAVIAGVAKYENRQRARRTTGGMRKALEDGRWVFKAPLGYRNGGKGNRSKPSLSPDPATAGMVRAAFGLAAAGLSEHEIQRRLALKGYAMPNGRPMSVQTVCKTLRNPIYAGSVRIAEWEISTPGDFKPLVDAATFARVQARLTRDAAPKARAREHDDFPLRGFVRCAECNRPLTAAWSKGRSKHYGHYWCNACKGSRVSKPDLECAFVALLARLQPRPEFAKLWSAVVRDVWAKRTASARDDRERLELHASTLRQRLDRIADLVGDGALDPETYGRQRDRLEQEIVVTEATLEDAVCDHLDVEGVLGFAERVLTDASRLWEHGSPDHKRRLQRTLFPEGVAYEAQEPGGFARTVVTCLAFGVSRDWNPEASPMVPETARTAATTSPLNGLGDFCDPASALVALRGFEPRSDG